MQLGRRSMSRPRLAVLGDGEGGLSAAKRLFGVSIVYLFVLFAALLLDSALGAPGRIML